MSFSVTHWTTARFIEKAAVSCSEERQKASIVMSGSRRCRIKRSVFGVSFATEMVDFKAEISLQIMQYPLNISKNPRRRVLERGAGAQLSPRKAEEPRIGRNYGSWTPLGTLAWVSSEKPKRLRKVPEGVLRKP